MEALCTIHTYRLRVSTFNCFIDIKAVFLKLWQKYFINVFWCHFSIFRLFRPILTHYVREEEYWRPTDRPLIWKISNGDISATRVIRSTSCLGLGEFFRGRHSADRIDLLPVGPNPRSGRALSWKILNEYIPGILVSNPLSRNKEYMYSCARTRRE